MSAEKDHLEIATKAIEVFANDGKLDEDELDQLLEIAERDGVIDDDEIRILSNIFARLRDHELSPAMRETIQSVEKKYDIKLT